MAEQTHRAWLAEAPFTLALGAGFFGFFAHTGVLLALEEAGLRPRRVTGVSAGALAGGLWASGLGARWIADELAALRRHDFWDPGAPLLGLLRGRKFAQKLASLLDERGVARVEDCATPFCAVAHDVLAGKPIALDEGSLAAAIQASCTVPLMFRPRIVGARLLVDGGVRDRNGEVALAPDERTMLHALRSRSPWRGLVAGSRRALDPSPTPTRATLVIPALPRVSPFRLEEGPRALDMAYRAAKEWLDAPR
ncbi:MAG: patatin-like phospholipase family protein [Nannocystaceae bacterium]